MAITKLPEQPTKPMLVPNEPAASQTIRDTNPFFDGTVSGSYLYGPMALKGRLALLFSDTDFRVFRQTRNVSSELSIHLFDQQVDQKTLEGLLLDIVDENLRLMEPQVILIRAKSTLVIKANSNNYLSLTLFDAGSSQTFAMQVEV